MSWRDALDRALDGRDADGPVRVPGPSGAEAEVDVEDAGPIGARVSRVRVRHGEDRDLVPEAERLEQVRALPHRLVRSEVDPGLGGAVLRSHPDDLDAGDFYEVAVSGPRDVEVRRWRVGEGGQREPAPWDATREQLGRLLDELDGPPIG